MIHTYLSIDVYNSSITCKFDDITYIFSSNDKFVELTGFPYLSTTGIISYEPARNIYVVERIGGICAVGVDSDEMTWIIANIDAIKQAAIDDLAVHSSITSTLTLTQQRDNLLYSTDWVLQRYQEETLLNLTHTITEAQLTAVLEYRQQLRDITKSYSSIDTVVWPTNPLA
jgi:hypothetical protein